MSPAANRNWLAVTKLAAPARRPDALPRARLMDRVAACLDQARMTLISAPAGAGKTSLLAELPDAFPETSWAWLLLDAEDNDPARVAAAIVAALATSGIVPSEAVAEDPRGLVVALINQVETVRNRRIVVVLDDLHAVTEPSVHDLLDYLAERLPSHFRLLLATRHDPPMSLARWRARGELAEIRMPELCFTEEETASLLNERLGMQLDSREIRLLQSRTEGWAAGLRLVATSLATLPGSRVTLLQHGMQGSRRIFDFLAEEVLERQPADVRNFLLKTSILASLRPRVCDTLTNRRDSAPLLEDLYRRNLFVVAADATETSFRYHDLFAEFLRERLRRERPDEWVALHRLAAQVETSEEQRIRHLLAAESWDDAAVLIEQAGFEFARRGFVVTVERWIAALPEAVRDRHPRLVHLLANIVWMRREFTQAHPFLKLALEGYRREGDAAGQAEVLAALAGTALMTKRFEESAELLSEALTYDIAPVPTRSLIHALAMWQNIHTRKADRARVHVDEVYRLLEEAPLSDPLTLMVILFSAGFPGYVDRIEGLCTTLRARLSGTADLTDVAYPLLNSYVCLHRGNIPEAQQQLDRAWELASHSGRMALVGMTLSYGKMALAAARRDWTEADSWASKVLATEQEYGLIIRNCRLHFQYFQARARWHCSDAGGLRQVYEQAMQPNPDESPAMVPFRSLIAAMHWSANRSYAKAEDAAREALRQEEVFAVTRTDCSARTMLAHVLLTRGHGEDAMEVFKPFLDETAEGNLAGFLMRDSPFIVPLLRRAHEKRMQRAHVERVLELLGEPLEVVASPKGEALSERELEVLRVMAEGLSNKEIASRLFVSEATVKTHVQHVMRKLDAGSRTQAAARGRELMLF